MDKSGDSPITHSNKTHSNPSEESIDSVGVSVPVSGLELATRLPLKPKTVFALQRSVGNRAVTQLLNRQISGGASQIQRNCVVMAHSIPTVVSPHKKAVDNFQAAIVSKVDEARNQLLVDPLLSAFQDNNYVKIWAKTWSIFKMRFAADNFTPKPRTFNARLGYAIEALTTLMLPDSFEGLNVYDQAIRGNTRPDIVLSTGTKDDPSSDVAWFDITSNTGHVGLKAGSWGKKDRVYTYEAVFQMLDPAALMAGGGKAVDISAVLAKIEEDKKEWQLRAASIRKTLAEAGIEDIPGTGESDSKKRGLLIDVLKEVFDPNMITPKRACAIACWYHGKQVHRAYGFMRGNSVYGQSPMFKSVGAKLGEEIVKVLSAGLGADAEALLDDESE